jgi:uncharacterized membrane protein SirB2
MSYLAVRHLHVTCVVLTISLFVLRGGLQFAGVDWRRRLPVLRVVPHVVDTVLLGSAVWLAWRSAQYPFVQPWLTAKVLALCAYVVLGKRALDPRRSGRARAVAFAGAVASIGYIVGVAVTRSPRLGLF